MKRSNIFYLYPIFIVISMVLIPRAIPLGYLLLCIGITGFVLGNTLYTVFKNISLKDLSRYIEIATDRQVYEAIEDSVIPIEVEVRGSLVKYFIIRFLGIESDIGIAIQYVETRREVNGYRVRVFVKGFQGLHRIPIIYLSIRDPLYSIAMILKVYSNIILRFVPRIPIQRYTPLKGLEFLYPGLVSTKRSGVGTEFLSVREYMPGDDLRRIDWKSSARLNRLTVKEFAHEVARGIVFVLLLHDMFFKEYESLRKIFNTILSSALYFLRLGLWIRLAIITERGYTVSNRVERKNIHELVDVVSRCEWPLKVSRTITVNRLARWIVQNIVNTSCREPCIAILLMDIQDELDINSLRFLNTVLSMKRHRLIIYTITPCIASKGVDVCQDDIYRLSSLCRVLRDSGIYVEILR